MDWQTDIPVRVYVPVLACGALFIAVVFHNLGPARSVPPQSASVQSQSQPPSASRTDDGSEEMERVRRVMPFWALPGCDRPLGEWMRAIDASAADVYRARWLACPPPPRRSAD
jgi:hypothetical protein